jgi:chromosome segregation ATPase
MTDATPAGWRRPSHVQQPLTADEMRALISEAIAEADQAAQELAAENAALETANAELVAERDALRVTVQDVRSELIERTADSARAQLDRIERRLVAEKSKHLRVLAGAADQHAAQCEEIDRLRAKCEAYWARGNDYDRLYTEAVAEAKDLAAERDEARAERDEARERWTDLQERLTRAQQELSDLIWRTTDTGVPNREHRLHGKRQGVSLALSYMDDTDRGVSQC